MFEGTVRENLVYNRTGVSDETLERACRACGIYHFIETLPHGFDTVLSENVAISAGQKQLFTIARAMVQNSSMLILDEGNVLRRYPHRAFDAAGHGCTDGAPHELRHCPPPLDDQECGPHPVMKDGDIIEQGTHESLLAAGGFYADLYNSQFEQAS